MDNPLRPTEIKTPHAGSSNVPEEVRERPLPQYETDSPLDANTKVPTSPTQLVKEELGEQKTATPVEKKKSKRGIAIASTIAGVALVGGAAAVGFGAMNSNNQSEVPPMPIDPAGVEGEEPAPDPEIIAQMKAMSADQFAELSQVDEQLPYVYYRIEANLDNHTKLATEWANKDPNDDQEERPTWTEPSRDMDAQAILDNVLYVIDDAELSVDASTGVKLLDKTEMEKKLYGAFYKAPTTNIVSDQFSEILNEMEKHENTFLTNNDWEAISSTELQTGNDLASNPIEYKDITFVDEHGITKTGRFVYKDFTSEDGEAKSAWLLEYYTTAN